jgi:hypothetical protein
MSLPFTEQQCFFVAILAFAVIGFQRGWRRELVTLVFVLLAFFLIHPDSSRSLGQFLARLPSVFAYLLGGSAAPQTATADQVTTFLGPWGPLLLFAAIIALGYYIGNKAFGKPGTPQERFIGVIPAIIYGAFILAYLSSILPKSQGNLVTVAAQWPDPSNYVPVIFAIAIVALIVALVAARAKKPPAGKK